MERASKTINEIIAFDRLPKVIHFDGTYFGRCVKFIGHSRHVYKGIGHSLRREIYTWQSLPIAFSLPLPAVADFANCCYLHMTKLCSRKLLISADSGLFPKNVVQQRWDLNIVHQQMLQGVNLLLLVIAVQAQGDP